MTCVVRGGKTAASISGRRAYYLTIASIGRGEVYSISGRQGGRRRPPRFQPQPAGREEFVYFSLNGFAGASPGGKKKTAPLSGDCLCENCQQYQADD